MPTNDDLRYLKELDLETKVMISKARIRETIARYGNDTYVSFSGGKDSTVLLDIVRSVDNTIPAVFVDTGLEYPELKEHVKTFTNVNIIRPTQTFKQVLEKHGYPVISKVVSHNIAIARRTPTGNIMKHRFLEKDGLKYDCSKYLPIVLADLDFKISDNCCNVMKKAPLHKLHKTPFVGSMTDESSNRKSKWLHNGCNAFDIKNPYSAPLSFWDESDIFEYIKTRDLKIPSVYGEIIESNGCYSCTGCKRTGCIYCGFGLHLEKRENNRLIRLKETHPKLYNYVINDLKFGYVYDTLNNVMKKEMFIYE